MTTEERFWQKVDKAGECWEWLGSRNPDGYGQFYFDGARHMVKAHRVSWEMAFGTIPETTSDYYGTCVLHKCDNPPCVRPDHLFLGTQTDNNRDRHAKGRSKNLDGGPSHPKAKLVATEVRQLREMYSLGWTQEQLAPLFGISRGNVSKIINKKLYKEVG